MSGTRCFYLVILVAESCHFFSACPALDLFSVLCLAEKFCWQLYAVFQMMENQHRTGGGGGVPVTGAAQ